MSFTQANDALLVLFVQGGPVFGGDALDKNVVSEKEGDLVWPKPGDEVQGLVFLEVVNDPDELVQLSLRSELFTLDLCDPR